MVLKVLYAGYKNPNYWAATDYAEMALRELGHEVTYFDYRSYALPGRLRDRLPALEAWDRARLNARLRAMAAGLKPDLFLVNGGHTLEPETIRAAKAAGATTALWVSDYPLLVDKYLALAPHYDHYFLSGTDALEHHRKAGNDRGVFLPFGCVPSLHKPVELTDAERRAYGSDVFLAGTAYPERVELLTALAGLGLDLALWGPGWDRLPAGHPLARFVRGRALRSQEFVKAASACKLAFNHMGYPMAPQMEEMCNLRVFELLGCGAFQMVDAKDDVKRLFQDGRELVWFKTREELLEKARHYLAHPEERAAVARRGREAALAKHTYRQRLETLLAACGLAEGAARG